MLYDNSEIKLETRTKGLLENSSNIWKLSSKFLNNWYGQKNDNKN